MKGIVNFIRECVQEMKKVSWPSKDDVIVSTRVVVISVFIISLILGALDYVLFYIINLIL